MYTKTKSKHKLNSIRVESIKDNPLVLNIFKNDHYLGQLDKRSGGIFITKRQEVFRKFDGFGINLALIESEIPFNTIVVKYNGLYFITTRQKFITDGELFSFDNGRDSKMFLPISAFKVANKYEIDS